MAKVPLQNISALSYIKTVEEASSAVSKWPEWKRERQLFSADCDEKKRTEPDAKAKKENLQSS